MPKTFSYRPKEYSIEELKKIAHDRRTNLNRMIEEALTQKIHQDNLSAKGGQAEVLARKITRVVVEHMGVELVKPDKKTHEKILRKARGTDKKGTWVSDENARPGR